MRNAMEDPGYMFQLVRQMYPRLVAHLILEWPREGMGHEIGVAPGGLGSSYPF